MTILHSIVSVIDLLLALIYAWTAYTESKKSDRSGTYMAFVFFLLCMVNGMLIWV